MAMAIAAENKKIYMILVEFLELAITSIVSLKGVYPQGAFERRLYMNVVVQRARHPQLRDYIHSSVTALLPFIEKGLLERLAIVFFTMDGISLERFVFKLAVKQSHDDNIEEVDLELSLRSLLIKLSAAESLTRPLSKKIVGGYLSITLLWTFNRLQLGDNGLFPLLSSGKYKQRCRGMGTDRNKSMAAAPFNNPDQVIK